MISFENLYKRYTVAHAPGPWVLEGVTLTIPAKARVGVIGNKGAGKSTLLKLITGAEKPTEGKLECLGRIASPASYNTSIEPLLTGRQNAKFICRINGCVDDLAERLSYIEQRVKLGGNFDKPVSTYTVAMKASFATVLSMTFDADYYISDGLNFAGEGAFKSKEAAEAALTQWIERAGIIMTAQGGQAESTLKRWCDAGIWVHEGKAIWFNDINDAFEAFKASKPPKQTASKGMQQPLPEHAHSIVATIKLMQNSMTILGKGLGGAPFNVGNNQILRLKKHAEAIGMELLTLEQITERGYQVKQGMTPILCSGMATHQAEEYFDINTQCEKSDS